MDDNRPRRRVVENHGDDHCQHHNKILAGVQDGWIYYRCSDCKSVIKVEQKKRD